MAWVYSVMMNLPVQHIAIVFQCQLMKPSSLLVSGLKLFNYKFENKYDFVIVEKAIT